jgi:DNA end-binding protein Ku
VAGSFIEALTEDFNPEEYTDEYRAAVMELIEAKLEDKDSSDLAREVKPKAATQSDDLMDALKASVAAVKSGKKAGGKKTSGTRARPARKRAAAPKKAARAA